MHPSLRHEFGEGGSNAIGELPFALAGEEIWTGFESDVEPGPSWRQPAMLPSVEDKNASLDSGLRVDTIGKRGPRHCQSPDQPHSQRHKTVAEAVSKSVSGHTEGESNAVISSGLDISIDFNLDDMNIGRQSYAGESSSLPSDVVPNLRGCTVPGSSHLDHPQSFWYEDDTLFEGIKERSMTRLVEAPEFETPSPLLEPLLDNTDVDLSSRDCSLMEMKIEDGQMTRMNGNAPILSSDVKEPIIVMNPLGVAVDLEHEAWTPGAESDPMTESEVFERREFFVPYGGMLGKETVKQFCATHSSWKPEVSTDLVALTKASEHDTGERFSTTVLPNPSVGSASALLCDPCNDAVQNAVDVVDEGGRYEPVSSEMELPWVAMGNVLSLPISEAVDPQDEISLYYRQMVLESLIVSRVYPSHDSQVEVMLAVPAGPDTPSQSAKGGNDHMFLND